MPSTIRTTTLPSGEAIQVLGQGTWKMGEDSRRRADEVNALKLGLDLGLTLIDTAEMYASGGAEEVVAQAIAGRRAEVFVVSKVLPSNASRAGVQRACENSLKRLQTDRIDLYLLHWTGSHPFEETLAGFDRLQRDGKIRYHGVSNFGLGDMKKWVALAGGETVASNQILYNLGRRGPEWDTIPWCREHDVTIMAYSPIEQGRILNNRALAEVAGRHGATPAQVALAWLLRQDGMMVIPKATKAEHVRENFAALKLRLNGDDLAALDRAFPPPKGPAALGML